MPFSPSVSAPFSLVVFDLDGTLIDSLPDITGALNQALAEAGRGALPDEVVRGYVGDGARALVERALAGGDAAVDVAADDGAVDALAGRFRHFYRGRLAAETRPYPGIVPLLERLSAAMPLAVVTNKPSELARPLLAALGLERFFADIVADGDGFARKPSPEAGLALLARHGAVASRTLVVGDGLPDVRFAHALGAPAAAAAWGYVARDALRAERPAWLIEEPAELLAIALGPG